MSSKEVKNTRKVEVYISRVLFDPDLAKLNQDTTDITPEVINGKEGDEDDRD